MCLVPENIFTVIIITGIFAVVFVRTEHVLISASAMSQPFGKLCGDALKRSHRAPPVRSGDDLTTQQRITRTRSQTHESTRKPISSKIIKLSYDSHFFF